MPKTEPGLNTRMSKQATHHRIAAVNGLVPLTEAAMSVPSMLSTLREMRSEILGWKQFRQGPSNDSLAAAANGLSDTLLALEEYQQNKNR